MGVVLRHDRADVGLDVDRPARLQRTEKLPRVGRQRTDLLLREVCPHVSRPEDQHGADRRRQQARGTGEVVKAHRAGVTAAGPVPATDQHHRDVEAHCRNAEEVGDRRETHHAAAEVGEVLRQAPGLHARGSRGAHHRPGLLSDRQRRVEQQPENEADCEVARQKARHHADGHHGETDEPVAEVVGQEQPGVGRAPTEQDDQVANAGEDQGDGEDADRRQVLAEHDLPVARGNREQELVGALPPLVSPDTHRDRRHEHQEDVGQVAVELVEVGEVRVEELGRPKGGQRPQQHEHADEDVARGVREISDEIPFEDGVEHMPLHVVGPSWMSCLVRVVIRWSKGVGASASRPAGIRLNQCQAERVSSWNRSSSDRPSRRSSAGGPSNRTRPSAIRITRSASASTSWRM